MLRIELHAFIYRLQKKFLKNIEICDLWKVLKSPLSATGTPLRFMWLGVTSESLRLISSLKYRLSWILMDKSSVLPSAHTSSFYYYR